MYHMVGDCWRVNSFGECVDVKILGVWSTTGISIGEDLWDKYWRRLIKSKQARWRQKTRLQVEPSSSWDGSRGPAYMHLPASEDGVVEGHPDVQVARPPVQRVHETLHKGTRRVVLCRCQSRIYELGRPRCTVRQEKNERNNINTTCSALSAALLVECSTCPRRTRVMVNFRIMSASH